VLVVRGAIGFKGSRKVRRTAAQQASLAAAGVARDQYGMKSVEVRVKGQALAVNPPCVRWAPPGCTSW